MADAPRRVLVVANETVGGRALIEAVKARAAESGPVQVRVCCPRNEPRHGYVVHDESVDSAATNRLETTIAQLREAGIDAAGEAMDPDPYSATMDAIALYGADEIVISTHPETRSGWMRRDLIDRVRDDTGLPVEHVVVDLDADREEATHTLVVANETMGGGPLIERIEAKAAEGPHRFVVICPHTHGDERDDAHERLEGTLKRLEHAGVEAVGQVSDPDPYTAVRNALDYYTVHEILVSTYPATRSGWMRRDLIERVKASTAKPVEHVVVAEEEARSGASRSEASAR